MANKIFVGGLSWGTDTQALGEAFEKYGDVIDAKVIVDRETGRSRGFGFVTFAEEASVAAAIEGQNEKELDGRVVRVSEAQEKPRRTF